MALSNTVNSILNKMHSQKVASDKGSYGEQAVFSICEDLYQRRGGILIHSYTYKTVPELAGNIKREGNSFYIENLGTHTEIDILLVTKYKMYPIEVKAYKANKINLTNSKIEGCASTSKSPEHQNEMHCRHLYPQIFMSLPNGSTDYIVPIVVFVDQATVSDSRTQDHKDYIKVTILNKLRQLLEENDKPHNGTILDLPAIETKLRNSMISCEKFLPYVKKSY